MPRRWQVSLLVTLATLAACGCKPLQRQQSQVLEAGRGNGCDACPLLLARAAEHLSDIERIASASAEQNGPLPFEAGAAGFALADDGGSVGVDAKDPAAALREAQRLSDQLQLARDKVLRMESLLQEKREALRVQTQRTDLNKEIKDLFVMQEASNIEVLESNLDVAQTLVTTVADIYKNLSDRIEALDLKFARNYEGVLTKLDDQRAEWQDAIRSLEKDMVTLPIMKPTDVDRMIEAKLRQASQGDNQQSLDSAFFHYPRAESRRTRSSASHAYISAGFVAPPFYPSHGFIQGGFVWNWRYVTDVTIAAKTLRPIFDGSGHANRDISVLCSVNKSTSVTKNVHAGGSAVIPLPLTLGMVGATVSGGGGQDWTTEQDTRRTSNVVNLPPGTHLSKVYKLCEDFERQVVWRYPLADDLRIMKLEAPKPDAASCMRDIDCSNAVGQADAWVVGQCEVAQGASRGYCIMRGIDGATCSPGKVRVAFSTNCARGLVCRPEREPAERGYWSSWLPEAPVAGECHVKPATAADFPPRPNTVIRDGVGALRAFKLSADGVKNLGEFRYDAGVELLRRYAEGEAVCGAGYRLPTRDELYGLAVWERETLRQKERRIRRHNASHWYYPEQMYDGFILGGENAAYMRATESMLTVVPNDAGVRARFVKEGVREPNFRIYCVRGAPLKLPAESEIDLLF